LAAKAKPQQTPLLQNDYGLNSPKLIFVLGLSPVVARPPVVPNAHI
jgi:hypothetical protein